MKERKRLKCVKKTGKKKRKMATKRPRVVRKKES